MNRLISKNKNKIARRDAVSGFTLIEMITVIAIFAVMAGVVLFSGSKFNDTVTLENLTQDVALSIREAQVKAISGSTSSPFGEDFTPSYGVHFTVNSNIFVHFVDLNDNDSYDETGTSCGTPTSECLKKITMQQGYKIESICGKDIAMVGTGPCTPVVSGSVDILFTRPFPAPQITRVVPPIEYSEMRLVLSSDTGVKKTIIAWATGQISVQ